MTQFILCRKTVNDIGEPTKYCSRPIEKQNHLDYCEECRRRIPIWPK